MTRSRSLATIDCETDPFRAGRIPTPFVWGHFDGCQTRYFWGEDCTERFVEFLSTRHENVYAHNGGKFDFHYLSSFLTGQRRIKIVNDRLVMAYLGRARLIDSYPILPFPLSAFRKEKINYLHLESQHREGWKTEILHYLRTDLESLYELVTRFREEYGPALTLASAAMRSLRDTIGPIPRGSRRFDERFREFYFGGRMQARAIGVFRGPWVYADQNSAYPTAMANGFFPIGHSYRTTSTLPDDPGRLRCSLVRLEASSQGALPFRLPDGSIEYPIDGAVSKYSATGHEVLAGLETGTLRIQKIDACFTFENVVSFAPWIKKIWQRRLNCQRRDDRAGELVHKHLLVGAYGKFGQNVDRFRDHYLFPYHPDLSPLRDLRPHSPVGWAYCGRVGRWWLWGRPIQHGHGFINVATAAMISGAVRARLLEAIVANDPIYCDTDAVICRPNFSGPEGIGTDLGQWKQECYDWAGIGGRKLYALRTDDRSRERFIPKLFDCNADDIFSVCRGKTLQWSDPAPTFSMSRGPLFWSRTLRSCRASCGPFVNLPD